MTENINQMTQEQAYAHTVNNPGWVDMFFNGERSGTRVRLFPDLSAIAYEFNDSVITFSPVPEDERTRLGRRRDFLKTKLSNEKTQAEDFLNRCREQFKFFLLGVGPMPPEDWEDQLNRGKERMAVLKEDLAEVERQLDPHREERERQRNVEQHQRQRQLDLLANQLNNYAIEA